MQHLAQIQISSHLAAEGRVRRFALVYYLHVVPTRYLAHGLPELYIVEIEYPVLPGDGLLYIRLDGKSKRIRPCIEMRLLSGFQLQRIITGLDTDAAFQEGRVICWLVAITVDVEPGTQHFNGRCSVVYQEEFRPV